MANASLKFTLKDYGYTVISRLEAILREDIARAISQSHGVHWPKEIPRGIWSKFFERSGCSLESECSNLAELLEETDFPDLLDIITFNRNFRDYYPSSDFNEVKKVFDRIYPIRCQIAHIKSSFTQMNFELLIELSRSLIAVMDIHNSNLYEFLDKITEPDKELVVKTPDSFFVNYNVNSCLNNLPDSDYRSDGGFVGRSKDIKKLIQLIKNNLDRIVTIIGAGGVGKSALAHTVCEYFITQEYDRFDSVIWVSAKEEYLSASGIEKLEPSFHNYEGLLDSISKTYSLSSQNQNLSEKEDTVKLIFESNDRGLLLVVDNLETIKDESVLDYIKNIPLPNKVLITSRLGLGEIERRMPLKELEENDAVKLVRTISREKSIDSILNLSDKVLKKYVEKMFRFPLAIKWTLGQVALGADINVAIDKLSAASGDLAKFCFQYIFDELLSTTEKRVLFSLSLYENPVGRGVISHVSNLEGELIDEAIRKLVVASLVLPVQGIGGNGDSIETKYDLLPLTRKFVQSEIRKEGVLLSNLSERKNATEHLVSEGERAGNEYFYSLSSYGASTEEEKIAVTLIVNAHRIYTQTKSYEKASEAFLRASEIAPNFAIIYRNWASIEAECELFDRADELMKRATGIDPNDPRLWFTWGNIEKKRQRYGSAVEYFERALVLSPDDGAILGMLGEIEKRRENFAVAEQYILDAIKKGQSQKETLRHEVVNKTVLADIYRRWGEDLRDSDRALAKQMFEKALIVAQEAFTLNQNDQKVALRVKEVYFAIGFFYHHEKKIGEAISNLLNSISLDSTIEKFKRINVRSYYYLALISHNQGDQKSALKYFEEGSKYFCGTQIEKNFVSLEKLLKGKKQEGILERIVPGSAFGFIKTIGDKPLQIFVHMNSFEESISLNEFERLVGERVSFLAAESMKNGRLQLEANFVKVVENMGDFSEGDVTAIVAEKGFGFVDCEGESIFFHVSNFAPKISQEYFQSLVGFKLRFNLSVGKRGSKGKMEAVNIRILPKSEF